MTKTTQNIFQILFKGILTYLKNIFSLTGFMLFPVLGQLIGIILILYPAYWLPRNIETLARFQINVDNLSSLCLALVIAVLPGFFVFTKAFWEYMVAMASLNSATTSLLRGNSLKKEHIKAYNYAIKSRGKSYVSLLLILSFIWFLAVIIPFAVNMYLTSNSAISIASFVLTLLILIVASIYFSLSFQVFAFEEISVFKVLKRSWGLVQGNFIRTCFLGLVLFAITSVAVPYAVQILVQNTSAVDYAAMPMKAYFADLLGNFSTLKTIPELAQIPFLVKCTSPQTSALCITDISQSTVLGTLAMIITGLMLPLGSICYTLLYCDIIDRKSAKKQK